MTPLQSKLLDMLAWYCEFCKEHSLNYYVTGGTLLGAARHNGFIPWDDDVDVCMPRPDYEKFLDITKNLNGKYYVDSPFSMNTDYIYAYAKIYDSDTTLIESGRYKVVRGIFIDVFPVDGVGNTLEEAREYYNRFIDPYKMFQISRITTLRKERGNLKNSIVLLSHILPKWIIDDRKLAQDIDIRCRKKSYENSLVVGNLFSTYRSKSIFSKDVIGEYTYLQFEGLKVQAVEKYDDLLSRAYGNWKELPPEDKRVTAHDFVEIDLNKPHRKR